VGRITLDIRGSFIYLFFTVKVVRHWQSVGCPIPGDIESQVGWSSEYLTKP